MLFAHTTAALAAKTAVPKAPLGALLAASLAADILSGVFSAVGLERLGADGTYSYPFSHGLFMSSVWSIGAAAAAFAVSKDRRMSLAFGLTVMSHWILDFISHPMGMGTVLPPDLPLLFEGSPKVGLGLYTYPAAAFPTEFGLYALGIIVYLRNTKAVDRTGNWAFWTVPLHLVLVAVLSMLPPRLFFIAAIAAVLLIPLGAWVDRHRTVRDTAPAV